MNLSKTLLMTAVCGSFLSSACKMKTEEKQNSLVNSNPSQIEEINQLDSLAKEYEAMSQTIDSTTQKVDKLIDQIQ